MGRDSDFGVSGFRGAGCALQLAILLGLGWDFKGLKDPHAQGTLHTASCDALLPGPPKYT